MIHITTIASTNNATTVITASSCLCYDVRSGLGQGLVGRRGITTYRVIIARRQNFHLLLLDATVTTITPTAANHGINSCIRMIRIRIRITGSSMMMMMMMMSTGTVTVDHTRICGGRWRSRFSRASHLAIAICTLIHDNTYIPIQIISFNISIHSILNTVVACCFLLRLLALYPEPKIRHSHATIYEYRYDG